MLTPIDGLQRRAVVALPGAGFAFGCLTVVSDIDLEAAQGQVPTETFELDLAVAVGGSRADGRVAQLVQSQPGVYFFQLLEIVVQVA